MVKRCHVCNRLYDGWRCPCRKTQHSHRRRASRGDRGGRRWQVTHAQAIILGELPNPNEVTDAEESETSL